MKDLNEISSADSQEKSAEKEIEEVIETASQEESQSEERESLDTEALENAKNEILEAMKSKAEGFKKATHAGAEESVEMHKKLLSELDSTLEIKREDLVNRYGDNEAEKIQGMISEVKEKIKTELSEFDHNASNVRNTEQMLRNQSAMKEGLEEMGKAKMEAEGQRMNEQQINFLESNGIASEGLDNFALGEKAKELRAQVNELRETLKSRRGDLGVSHKKIISNPNGELAGLKELEESTRPVEAPKKKTIADRIRGIFGR